jgi:hypothetical protein
LPLRLWALDVDCEGLEIGTDERTTDLDADIPSARGDSDYPTHTNPRRLASCGIESDPRTVSGTSSSLGARSVDTTSVPAVSSVVADPRTRG